MESTRALVCPHCRSPLERGETSLVCSQCHLGFEIDNDIADFSGGDYYDERPDEDSFDEVQLQGLRNEEVGSSHRIDDFFGPRLRHLRARSGEGVFRVLDSGCGNGLSVDLLDDQGFEAWGNDLSQVRKWQWRLRRCRDRLVVSDSRRLPFPDGFFHAVLCSGVLEHIGVDEGRAESYFVRPNPRRDQERIAFLEELTRVLASGGVLYLDFPNGAFPIDFWHGDHPGQARFHSRTEGFLPTVREIRGYLSQIGRFRLEPQSPHQRLRFHQVSKHWYGRLLRLPIGTFLKIMNLPVLRVLAGTGLNPYLVLRIERVREA